MLTRLAVACAANRRREETSDPRELVAAFARADGQLSLLFVREHANGRALEVVTRRDGQWRLEWSGPIARWD